MIEATKPLVYVPNGIQTEVGGHAANVAIDLTQLGQKNVIASGCIGQDLWGGFIQEEMKAKNIQIFPQIEENVKTAKAIVLVVENIGNLFYAELTANTLLSAEHVTSLLQTHKPTYFYLGTIGGLKYIDKKLRSLLQIAKKINCITFIDVILPSNNNWKHIEKTIPFIDILHLNEIEGKEFTKENEPVKAAKEIVAKGVKLCVLSQGDKGLLAANVKKVLEMPAFRVDQIDPTGAGDALCAGILNTFFELGLNIEELGNIPEKKLKTALLTGQAAGAACVTSVGSTTSVHRATVQSLIEDQGERIFNNTRIIK
jgi:sugar/nucleoside kinase (ribokinase family)